MKKNFEYIFQLQRIEATNCWAMFPWQISCAIEKPSAFAIGDCATLSGNSLHWKHFKPKPSSSVHQLSSSLASPYSTICIRILEHLQESHIKTGRKWPSRYSYEAAVELFQDMRAPWRPNFRSWKASHFFADGKSGSPKELTDNVSQLLVSGCIRGPATGAWCGGCCDFPFFFLVSTRFHRFRRSPPGVQRFDVGPDHRQPMEGGLRGLCGDAVGQPVAQAQPAELLHGALCLRRRFAWMVLFCWCRSFEQHMFSFGAILVCHFCFCEKHNVSFEMWRLNKNSRKSECMGTTDVFFSHLGCSKFLWVWGHQWGHRTCRLVVVATIETQSFWKFDKWNGIKSKNIVMFCNLS